MNRKQFFYKLLDKEEHIFTERNREDVDYSQYQDKVRTQKIKFAEANVNDEALRDGIIMQQMDKVYDNAQIGFYIQGHPEEQKQLVYASFKINQPGITFEKFNSLVDDSLCNKLLEMINKLEAPEPITDGELMKLTRISKAAIDFMKKKQPGAFEALKRTVKKNPGVALAAK